MTILDIDGVRKNMDKIKAQFERKEGEPEKEAKDIPPVHPDLLRHALLLAKDDLDALFSDDEDVSTNVANATLAAAIYHGLKRDKKGLNKRVRKMVTRDYALNIAYRLTSMMGMLGEHPEIDFRDCGAEMTNIAAVLPLKAGMFFDGPTFIERLHFQTKNKK